MQETWRDIVGFEGLYKVSNSGHIVSYAKGLITPRPNTKGYMRVTLYKNSKPHRLFVHRLVALHFVPNPAQKPQVNHINGNKLDNYSGNLEWVTNQENRTHAVQNGLHSTTKGEERENAVLTEIDVIWIRNHYVKGHKEFGSKPLSRKFKVSPTTIRYIIERKKWKHI